MRRGEICLLGPTGVSLADRRTSLCTAGIRGYSEPSPLHTIWLNFSSRTHFWCLLGEIGTPIGPSGLGSGLMPLSLPLPHPRQTTATHSCSALVVDEGENWSCSGVAENRAGDAIPRSTKIATPLHVLTKTKKRERKGDGATVVVSRR
ncbi:hypothetical protein JCGZ_24330 [Jatropha curcas]|uniref:Uncharacterized protein n=1 Tax=Jatropha curcas TaxID=180498 RepID=A0A067L252_JATCU|nr:hypothetical protein JCGZ_24330 [Jatropha curcas]